MEIEDMLDLQIGIAYTKAIPLIDNLKEGQALYIINKNMKARILFYYKENTYFISDIIPLNIDYIEFFNDDEIADISKFISEKFECIDLLLLYTLIRDKKSIILNYLINSLVIKVDRLNNSILDIASLEIYNDLLVINMKGIFKLFKYNDTIYYDKFNTMLLSKRYILEDILKDIYEEYDIFPHDYKYKVYNTFNIKDIIPSDDISPIIAIAMISSEELVSFGMISLRNDLKYKNKDVVIAIKDIIDTVNESDDIESDIELALNDLYYNYESDYKILN